MPMRYACSFRTPTRPWVSVQVDRTGLCLFDCGQPFPLEMDRQAILLFNKSFEQILDRVRKRCNQTKSLDIDKAFCHQVMLHLATTGRSAWNTIGDPFDTTWNNRIGDNSDWPITITTSDFPLLWECLYPGDYDRIAAGEYEQFLGLRHNLARAFRLGADGRAHQGFRGSREVLFCHHNELQHARQELAGLRSALGPDFAFCVYDELPDSAPKVELDAFFALMKAHEYGVYHFAVHKKLDSSSPNALEAFLEITRGNKALRVPLVNLSAAQKPGFQQNPLIFLNACKTGHSLETLFEGLSFPSVFVKWGAAAVIATVCKVPDFFAQAFASKFFQTIAEDKSLSLGDCLLRTRRYFMDTHNNPLGLAYVLYAYGDIYLKWE